MALLTLKQIGMSFWLHNGFQPIGNHEDPMYKYDDLLGEAPDGQYTQSVTVDG
jgi:hypothetical protein